MAAVVNEENPFNLIPQHLFIEEILVRLPVKSLLRCKIVCKEWNFIISSRDFAELQLNFSKSKPSYNQLNTLFLFGKQNCILMNRNSEQEYDDIGHKTMNKNNKKEKEEIRYGFRIEDDIWELIDEIWNSIDIPKFPLLIDEIKYNFWYSQCLGSCNGLVCFYFAHTTAPKPFFCIWNPCTNHSKYVILPHTFKFNVGICGFFYFENDYKIVAFGFPFLSNTKWGGVYSLNTNSWTEIPLQNLLFDIGLISYGDGYCTQRVDEMLYWKIENRYYNNDVIGFNMKYHTFHQLPFCNTNFKRMRLCNLGGSLCGWGYVYDYQLDKIFLEIWRFDNKENSGLWTIMFKFDDDYFSDIVDIIGVTKDGNIIMQSHWRYIFVVKQNEDHEMIVPLIHDSVLGAMKFNASLVSPYHYTIQDTEEKVYEMM